MPSMYAKYVEEREPGRKVIETEEGFVKYLIQQDYCYIEDLYVLPEYRRAKAAFRLADQVAVIGKANGCKTLIAGVSPPANGTTGSLQVILAYGFKLKSASDSMVWFVKEL